VPFAADEENDMHIPVRAFWITAVLVLASACAAAAADDHHPAERGQLVVVFKDGHRQTFEPVDIQRIDFKAPGEIVFKDGRKSISTAEVARIEFVTAPSVSGPGHNHFVGKWQVGDGNGRNFYITLEDSGEARKTIGSPHGTWTLVNGEARIAWEDGWHDVIRKVGARHEKVAFEPGKTFDDPPSNVASAKNTEVKPI
jgi:hypothetical protein